MHAAYSVHVVCEMGTHVAEKYVRQVNFYRGSTIFVSVAALKPSMSLCCCTALKIHLTDVLFGDMSMCMRRVFKGRAQNSHLFN